MYIPGIYLSRFTIKMYYIVKGSFEKKKITSISWQSWLKMWELLRR